MVEGTAAQTGIAGLDRRLLRQCVHCGFCLQACPTYRALGVEMDSPRGRIFQIKAVADGKISADDPEFRRHMYLCLDCRACETACPSGVQYGQLVEAARASIQPTSDKERMAKDLILGRLFPSTLGLEAAGTAMRLYQKSGVQSLVRRSGMLRLFGTMGKLEGLLPPMQGRVLEPPLPRVVPARGTRRFKAAVVSGCVMNQFFRRTNLATVRVLAENGGEVVVPRDQACCGALHVHSGARDLARDLARRNIAAFERAEAEVIIINAAGCGSTLKEYGSLLADDPAYAERAEAFSRKVRDVTEFLGDLPLKPPAGELRCRVTYQDACHLAHAQRVRDQPRALLRAIPGLELVEMDESDSCCGSAGIYNLTNYDLSMDLLNWKMDRIEATGAQIVASANPGCAMQILHGINARHLRMEVAHPVDLLDRAYRGVRRATAPGTSFGAGHPESGAGPAGANPLAEPIGAAEHNTDPALTGQLQSSGEAQVHPGEMRRRGHEGE
ncbi:MAG: heterodisulfide reductase-related iron-sulfur binding cluster [Chloroflexota bacterium]